MHVGERRSILVTNDRYGEFGTQPRDLCAASQLHHTVIRSARPPPSAPVRAGEKGLGWCPAIRPLNCHAGAPMSFCGSMSYHPGQHDVTVDVAAFAGALADALAVTGLRPLACEAENGKCPAAFNWG